jgi:hypothetical protein
MVMPAPVWQAQFPTPYQIPYFKWSGEPDVVDPRTGNQLKTWNAPVPQWVQGWDILTSEELAGFETEQKFSVYLMVGPDFWPGIRDRFGLPTPSNSMTLPIAMFESTGAVQPGIFEVVGHDIEAFGFTNWRPGNIVLLKAVE